MTRADHTENSLLLSPGVKNIPTDSTCPLAILKTFLTDKMVADIVDYTNSYAYLLKRVPENVARLENERSLLNLWKDTTIIGLQILCLLRQFFRF